MACPRAGAKGLGLWTMLRTLRSRWGCDLPITTSLGPSADVAASLFPRALSGEWRTSSESGSWVCFCVFLVRVPDFGVPIFGIWDVCQSVLSVCLSFFSSFSVLPVIVFLPISSSP